LAGELAEWLGEWLPQLCVAYGWRLERISIRPQYIQWTVQVPPTVSPGYMVRILREETSRRILKNQPELLVNNPANDFWAPGYLVMSGFLPPTQQMLEEYIQQTRRRQGLEPQDN
jgi:REP element-mobilizing transposase RayT